MPTDLDPQIASYLRRMETSQGRLQAQFEALNKRYSDLAAESADDKLQIQRLNAAVTKAAKRIRYIEDIPGKRIPYFMTWKIQIPGPTTPTTSVVGQRLSDTKQVSADGPFVATQYLGGFLLRTFSLGPYTLEAGGGRPNDPSVGSEVFTPLSGRWRPLSSSADPFSGAYIGPGVGPISIAGAQVPQTFRPGIIDFLFEIQDESVDRLRQNQIPIPSRYIFSEFDRPLYLPVSDFFERTTPITFSATLTRDIGLAEINYTDTPQGFAEGSLQPPPDPAALGNVGRVVVALGGDLYFTMLGYKILQAQSPAV